MPEHPASPEGAATPATGPKRWLRWVLGLAVGVPLGLLLCALAVAAWALGTTSGLVALADLAESASGGAVRLRGVDGRLADRLTIAELTLELPDLRLRGERLELAWDPPALRESRLHIARLAAGVLRIATRPSGEPAAPLALPEQLALPLAVTVDALSVGDLGLSEWVPQGFGSEQFHAAAIDAALSAEAGKLDLARLSIRLPWGSAAASGRLGLLRPFPLQLSASLDGRVETTLESVAQSREYHLKLAADGDLRRPRLAIDATGAGMAGQAEVVARPFDPVPIESARIDLGEIDPSAFVASAPQAALRVRADLRIADRPDGSSPPPERWEVAGPLEVSNARARSWDQGGIPVDRLAGTIRWSEGALRAEGLELKLSGGGRLAGSAGWAPLADDPAGRFEAALTVAGVNPQALDARLPKALLEGRLGARGDGKRQQLEATLADPRLALDLAASHGSGAVEVSRLALRQGEARLDGRARLQLDGGMPFSASLTVQALNPQRLFASAPEASLGGVVDLAGKIEPALQLDASYRLAPATTLAGYPLEGEGRLTVVPDRIRNADLWLALAGNRLEARGSWGAEGDELAYALHASALEAIQRDLQGSLEVQGRLSGTPAEPAGELLATASKLVLPGGWRVAGVNLQGRLQRGLDGPFVLAAGIGEVHGADRELVLDHAGISVEGTRGAHRAELAASGADGDEVAARLQGGLGGDLSWHGVLEALDTAGRLRLHLQNPAELAVARDSLHLGAATLGFGDGRIELARTDWSPQGIAVQGKASGLGFGLVQEDGGRTRRSGRGLQLGGEWDLEVGEQVNGVLRIQRESGDLVLVGDAPASLGLSEFEAILSANDGRLALSAHARGSRLGRLAASLSARAERHGNSLRLVPDSPLLGSANLDMPSIGWLGPLVDANLGTGGSLEADFSLAGTPETPLASGRLLGKDLDFNLADVGLRLSGGTLEAGFDRDYLRIVKFEFLSPNRVRPNESRIPVDKLMAEPGHFLASGGIDLATGYGTFGFAAQRLPMLQRPDRWLALSGEGSIETGWDHMDLKARLEADAGAIAVGDAPAPSLSDDVVVKGREKKPSGFAVSADVAVNLGSAFYLTAMGLDTRLTGGIDFTVRPDRATHASGVIHLEDGQYEGYGPKLAVDNSTVNFAGPPENPSLNITALRKGLEVEAGISITGSARRPRIQLVSFPNVPDTEKLSWIVLGRAPDTSGSNDLGLLIPAAAALLGGPGGGVTKQLSSSLGLDQFSIGQGDLNSANRGATSSVVDSGTRSTPGTVSGQVVTLGKRLSADTFLAFEQSLAGAESIVKLTHQLGRRISLVARGGTDNALDLYYTFTFR